MEFVQTENQVHSITCHPVEFISIEKLQTVIVQQTALLNGWWVCLQQSI